MRTHKNKETKWKTARQDVRQIANYWSSIGPTSIFLNSSCNKYSRSHTHGPELYVRTCICWLHTESQKSASVGVFYTSTFIASIVAASAAYMCGDADTCTESRCVYDRFPASLNVFGDDRPKLLSRPPPSATLLATVLFVPQIVIYYVGF